MRSRQGRHRDTFYDTLARYPAFTITAIEDSRNIVGMGLSHCDQSHALEHLIQFRDDGCDILPPFLACLLHACEKYMQAIQVKPRQQNQNGCGRFAAGDAQTRE